MGYTIVSVAILQNYAIMFISQISILKLKMPKSKLDDAEEPTISISITLVHVTDNFEYTLLSANLLQKNYYGHIYLWLIDMIIFICMHLPVPY